MRFYDFLTSLGYSAGEIHNLKAKKQSEMAKLEERWQNVKLTELAEFESEINTLHAKLGQPQQQSATHDLEKDEDYVLLSQLDLSSKLAALDEPIHGDIQRRRPLTPNEVYDACCSYLPGFNKRDKYKETVLKSPKFVAVLAGLEIATFSTEAINAAFRLVSAFGEEFHKDTATIRKLADRLNKNPKLANFVASTETLDPTKIEPCDAYILRELGLAMPREYAILAMHGEILAKFREEISRSNVITFSKERTGYSNAVAVACMDKAFLKYIYPYLSQGKIGFKELEQAIRLASLKLLTDEVAVNLISKPQAVDAIAAIQGLRNLQKEGKGRAEEAIVTAIKSAESAYHVTSHQPGQDQSAEYNTLEGARENTYQKAKKPNRGAADYDTLDGAGQRGEDVEEGDYDSLQLPGGPNNSDR